MSPPTTAANLSTTSPSPFWSPTVQVSLLEESLTTSVLGAGTVKRDHPWGADLHMVPGWAAGPRGAGLVLEGSMRHRSAPAQGIGALRVVCGEDRVQGPMVTAAMNGLWDFMGRRRALK